MKVIKKCVTCNKKFMGPWNKKYCSPDCNPNPCKTKEAREFVCKECGKPFKAFETKRTYCSVECLKIAGGKKLTKGRLNGPHIRNCPVCRQWCETTDIYKRFCSPACERENPKKRKEIRCRYCGMPVLNPTKVQYTCGSHKCKKLAALERRTLKYGPHSINPTLPYSGNANPSAKRQIANCANHQWFKKGDRV